MADFAKLGRSAQRFLRTEQGKKVGAQVLRRAADAADGLTKQKYTARIEQARSAAEKGLGTL